MPLQQTELAARVDEARDRRLQDYYTSLNPHLQAALLHARSQDRRENRDEPCGGDSAMD